MHVETLYYLPITQKHIECGQPCEVGNCPIALAIREAVPQATGISVSDQNAVFTLPRWCYHLLDLDQKGREFVIKFDEREKVEPFVLFLKRGQM